MKIIAKALLIIALICFSTATKLKVTGIQNDSYTSGVRVSSITGYNHANKYVSNSWYFGKDAEFIGKYMVEKKDCGEYGVCLDFKEGINGGIENTMVKYGGTKFIIPYRQITEVSHENKKGGFFSSAKKSFRISYTMDDGANKTIEFYINNQDLITYDEFETLYSKINENVLYARNTLTDQKIEVKSYASKLNDLAKLMRSAKQGEAKLKEEISTIEANLDANEMLRKDSEQAEKELKDAIREAEGKLHEAQNKFRIQNNKNISIKANSDSMRKTLNQLKSRKGNAADKIKKEQDDVNSNLDKIAKEMRKITFKQDTHILNGVSAARKMDVRSTSQNLNRFEPKA